MSSLKYKTTGAGRALIAFYNCKMHKTISKVDDRITDGVVIDVTVDEAEELAFHIQMTNQLDKMEENKENDAG
tara:strand:+ start:1232 stop:1450 length:219 start_codon:yes stop_codon:yes gene_type:complete